MAKRKSVAQNKTELADLLNQLDGLRMGYSRKDYRAAIKLISAVDIACRVRNYKSPLAMMAKVNIKKALKLKAK
jgi:hypothetical protein